MKTEFTVKLESLFHRHTVVLKHHGRRPINVRSFGRTRHKFLCNDYCIPADILLCLVNFSVSRWTAINSRVPGNTVTRIVRERDEEKTIEENEREKWQTKNDNRERIYRSSPDVIAEEPLSPEERHEDLEVWSFAVRILVYFSSWRHPMILGVLLSISFRIYSWLTLDPSIYWCWYGIFIKIVTVRFVSISLLKLSIF